MNLFLSDPFKFALVVIFSFIGVMTLFGMCRIAYLTWASHGTRSIVSSDLLPFTMSLLFALDGLSFILAGINKVTTILLIITTIVGGLVVSLFHGLLMGMKTSHGSDRQDT